MQFDEDGQLLPFEDDQITHVLSYDEKRGIQAIANVADDLMPNESNGTIKRDYEYKRLGTILGGNCLAKYCFLSTGMI